jgi:hypothetical protein
MIPQIYASTRLPGVNMLELLWRTIPKLDSTKPLECLQANYMLQKIASHQAKCDDT